MILLQEDKNLLPNQKTNDCKKWLSNIFKDAYIIDEVEYFKKLKEDLNEEVMRRTLLHKDQWTRNNILLKLILKT